jgi:hypothetical protein
MQNVQPFIINKVDSFGYHMYFLVCIQLSLMMSCNSQACPHNPERVDASHSAILSNRTSLTPIDNELINPFPIVIPIHTSDAVVVNRAPPTAPSPPAVVPSPRRALSTTAYKEVASSTISDIIQEVIQVVHPAQPPLEPSPLEVVQLSLQQVDYDVANEDASTPPVECPQTEPQSHATASTSAVNVIPLDSSNPEATLNAPQAVRRFLTRWPQGEKEPHPVFNNVGCEEFRTMHNNQDDQRRRAELAKVVPSHVKVSLFHPMHSLKGTLVSIDICLFRPFHLPSYLKSRSFGFRLHSIR